MSAPEPQAWPHEPWDQMAHNRLVVNTAELERQLIRARGASHAVGQQVAELRADVVELLAEVEQLQGIETEALDATTGFSEVVSDNNRLTAEVERLSAENAQLRTLLPSAKCDCGHARHMHRDCDDHDECRECPCTELRFGEAAS